MARGMTLRATATLPDRETSEQHRISDAWGERTPYGPGDEWPQRVDQLLAEGVGESDVECWFQAASVLLVVAR